MVNESLLSLDESNADIKGNADKNNNQLNESFISNDDSNDITQNKIEILRAKKAFEALKVVQPVKPNTFSKRKSYVPGSSRPNILKAESVISLGSSGSAEKRPLSAASLKARQRKKEMSNVSSSKTACLGKGVGVAAAPKRDVVSKIQSFSNASHKPGGGNVKITNSKIDFKSRVTSRIGSLDNKNHVPKQSNVKILHKKIDLSNVKSKCGSLENKNHVPKGGNVSITSKKLDLTKVSSRCGSLTNVKHSPGGGNVKILDKSIDLSNVKSKCGSLENANYTPKRSEVKILNKKMDLSHIKSKDGRRSMQNKEFTGTKSNVKIFNEKISWESDSKVGSLENAKHIPGGGDVKIYDESKS